MKELELNVRSVTNLEHMHTSITGDDCHVLLPISDFFFSFSLSTLRRISALRLVNH